MSEPTTQAALTDAEVTTQHCFPTKDGKYTLCDVIHMGKKKKLTPTKSGKWWRIPRNGRRKRQNFKTENETRKRLVS